MRFIFNSLLYRLPQYSKLSLHEKINFRSAWYVQLVVSFSSLVLEKRFRDLKNEIEETSN